MTLFSLVVVGLIAGSFQHTDRTRKLARIYRLAMARCGMSVKETAILQGLDESLLTRQLEARDGLTPSYFRMAHLPDRFHQERLKLEAPAYGLIVLEADQIGAGLELVSRLPRMLKARLSEPQKDEGVA